MATRDGYPGCYPRWLPEMLPGMLPEMATIHDDWDVYWDGTLPIFILWCANKEEPVRSRGVGEESRSREGVEELKRNHKKLGIIKNGAATPLRHLVDATPVVFQFT